jgi:hypothetical protein
LRRNAIEIAIVAVPAAEAQAVADLLVAVGVHAILNYAPTTLNVPASVRVEDVDPVIHLQRMAFHLRPPTRLATRPAVRPKARPIVRRRTAVRTTTNYSTGGMADAQFKVNAQLAKTAAKQTEAS